METEICSLSTDTPAAEDDQRSSLNPEDTHDSSICCMHSHRLPLIHLKTSVVFLCKYCKPRESWKPLVPYFIQDQNSACTAAHSEVFSFCFVMGTFSVFELYTEFLLVCTIREENWYQTSTPAVVSLHRDSCSCLPPSSLKHIPVIIWISTL